jgi:hypothetical protein
MDSKEDALFEVVTRTMRHQARGLRRQCEAQDIAGRFIALLKNCNRAGTDGQSPLPLLLLNSRRHFTPKSLEQVIILRWLVGHFRDASGCGFNIEH